MFLLFFLFFYITSSVFSIAPVSQLNDNFRFFDKEALPLFMDFYQIENEEGELFISHESPTEPSLDQSDYILTLSAEKIDSSSVLPPSHVTECGRFFSLFKLVVDSICSLYQKQKKVEETQEYLTFTTYLYCAQIVGSVLGSIILYNQPYTVIWTLFFFATVSFLYKIIDNYAHDFKDPTPVRSILRALSSHTFRKLGLFVETFIPECLTYIVHPIIGSLLKPLFEWPARRLFPRSDIRISTSVLSLVATRCTLQLVCHNFFVFSSLFNYFSSFMRPSDISDPLMLTGPSSSYTYKTIQMLDTFKNQALLQMRISQYYYYFRFFQVLNRTTVQFGSRLFHSFSSLLIVSLFSNNTSVYQVKINHHYPFRDALSLFLPSFLMHRQVDFPYTEDILVDELFFQDLWNATEQLITSVDLSEKRFYYASLLCHLGEKLMTSHHPLEEYLFLKYVQKIKRLINSDYKKLLPSHLFMPHSVNWNLLNLDFPHIIVHDRLVPQDSPRLFALQSSFDVSIDGQEYFIAFVPFIPEALQPIEWMAQHRKVRPHYFPVLRWKEFILLPDILEGAFFHKDPVIQNTILYMIRDVILEQPITTYESYNSHYIYLPRPHLRNFEINFFSKELTTLDDIQLDSYPFLTHTLSYNLKRIIRQSQSSYHQSKHFSVPLILPIAFFSNFTLLFDLNQAHYPLPEHLFPSTLPNRTKRGEYIRSILSLAYDTNSEELNVYMLQEGFNFWEVIHSSRFLPDNQIKFSDNPFSFGAFTIKPSVFYESSEGFLFNGTNMFSFVHQSGVYYLSSHLTQSLPFIRTIDSFLSQGWVLIRKQPIRNRLYALECYFQQKLWTYFSQTLNYDSHLMSVYFNSYRIVNQTFKDDKSHFKIEVSPREIVKTSLIHTGSSFSHPPLLVNERGIVISSIPKRVLELIHPRLVQLFLKMPQIALQIHLSDQLQYDLHKNPFDRRINSYISLSITLTLLQKLYDDFANKEQFFLEVSADMKRTNQFVDNAFYASVIVVFLDVIYTKQYFMLDPNLVFDHLVKDTYGNALTLSFLSYALFRENSPFPLSYPSKAQPLRYQTQRHFFKEDVRNPSVAFLKSVNFLYSLFPLPSVPTYIETQTDSHRFVAECVCGFDSDRGLECHIQFEKGHMFNQYREILGGSYLVHEYAHYFDKQSNDSFSYLTQNKTFEDLRVTHSPTGYFGQEMRLISFKTLLELAKYPFQTFFSDEAPFEVQYNKYLPLTSVEKRSISSDYSYSTFIYHKRA